MAQKRMFNKDVTNSDEFLDMPLSSQALYFHLGMNADDDWFVQPKSIMRMIQAKEDDLKILLAKWFCIVFADSVVVITHRKQNNQIKNDRYKPSIYQEHLKMLWISENKAYKLMDTECIQNGSKMDPQYRLEENRLDKISIDKISKEKDGFKKKSIVNKNNLEESKQVYDVIKKHADLVDGSLDDCVVLLSKLKKLWDDPAKILDDIIVAMIHTWQDQYYSIASPYKLSINLWTIYNKIKANLNKSESKQTVVI